MSAIKPVIRQLKQAVLDGMSHARDKLHHLADNLTDHLDNVVREVRGIDKFDDAPSRPRPRPDGGDSTLVPRPETLDANGKIDWDKAPHNGFRLDDDGNPIMHDHMPQAGDRFDRYGDPRGSYVSPIPEDGPYSFDSRSLPYEENPNAYHEYEWIRPLTDAESQYNQLDDETRDVVDAGLDYFEQDVSNLSPVHRGDAAAIPEWGTPGGAVQDHLPVSVELLNMLGLIREVP